MLIPLLIVVGTRLVILALAFLLGLGHRWSSLLAFLLCVGLSMVLMYGVGIHPLGFFVSPGGWLWFVIMALVVAATVRRGGTIWDRRLAQRER